MTATKNVTGLASERIKLAAELVEDVEQYKLPAEQLLMKARRLASLAGDEDAYDWIGWELAGYPSPGHGSRQKRWLDLTKRSTSVPGQHDIVESLPRIEDQIIPSFDDAATHNARTARMFQLRKNVPGAGPTPDPVPWEKSVARIHGDLLRFQGVSKSVRAALHDFVIRTYHRFAFNELASTIFDRHKTTVDALLTETAGEVLDKIPDIYDRLASGSPEAISQAMNSCRRMIGAFADIVYPPRSEPALGADGRLHPITKAEVCNRIEQRLGEGNLGASRYERLSDSLRDIWASVSKGTHADVSAGEAQSLFLATYLLLGEIAEATRNEPSAAARGPLIRVP